MNQTFLGLCSPLPRSVFLGLCPHRPKRKMVCEDTKVVNVSLVEAKYW
jgi:hypothetical protein